ncbi:MAG: metal-dependent hydrolase [Bacteroidales bacterium]|jgi:hypothetical protein|nr:metal-dependent hydrolase [Bacteroidales bacterium]
MDILTHTVTGLTIGSIVVNLLPTHQPVTKSLSILLFGMLGGALPDIDAISLWSGFDAHFGRWFAHSGKEIYSGKWWYSHHGFCHSVVAAVLTGFLLSWLIYAIRRIFGREKTFRTFWRTYQRPLFYTFLFAAFAHFLCDCVTPASTWGGVRLWWPLPFYIGGWGDVWWWNNYDIFLIVAACFLMNVLWMGVCVWLRKEAGNIPLLFALVAVVFISVQVHNRQTNYAYEGATANYQQLEEASKKEQQRILGPAVYQRMEKFDRWLPFYF